MIYFDQIAFDMVSQLRVAVPQEKAMENPGRHFVFHCDTLIIYYSDRRLLTGLLNAAFIVWKLTVSNVMMRAAALVAMKTQPEISVRYSYRCSQPSRK